MLIITWITFLFGAGMPILFPIALFGMSVLYITNRISLAYFSRSPPVYDEKLNDTTIRMLAFAPILYTMMGCYIYTDSQMFSNDLHVKTGPEVFST